MFEMKGLLYILPLAISMFLAGTSNCSGDGFAPGSEVPENVIRQKGTDRFFYETEITDEVFSIMEGRSFKEYCTTPRKDLRYVRILHKDISGRSVVGEVVCHKDISGALLEIFRQLYDASYPIQSVRLVDYYDADDEKSMEANNSSSFNFRKVPQSGHLSYHAYGLAIDINPLYNPYYKKYPDGHILLQPDGSEPYLDRTGKFDYKIEADDLCVRLFKKYGFEWGGDWQTCKDYQHFELIRN